MALKLLAVFARPDDESMGGALVKYAAEGVETSLICKETDLLEGIREKEAA